MLNVVFQAHLGLIHSEFNYLLFLRLVKKEN